MQKRKYKKLFSSLLAALFLALLLLNQAPFTANSAAGAASATGAAQSYRVHRVEAGETLYLVALKYGLSLQELLKTNAYLRFPELIYPGQVLIIPPGRNVDEVGSEYERDAEAGVEPSFRPSPPVQPAAQPQPSISQLASIYRGRFFLRGATGSPVVALTFDDGPDGIYTPRVLDVLREYGVPATFFLIGQNARQYPEVVRRIAEEGHIIGNHTWSHPDLRRTAPISLAGEMKWTEFILEATTGLRTTLMRPPYGAVNEETLKRLMELDYYILYWSVDSRDWEQQCVDSILINTLLDTREGAVILLHSAGGGQSRAATVEALPELIETLRMQGYRFVTVDKLLGIPAYR